MRDRSKVAPALLCIFLAIVPAESKSQESDTVIVDFDRREELAVFLEEFSNDHMSDMFIPGATVAIVRGEHVFVQEFGYADLAKKSRIDSYKTLFRMASVGKIVTAIAVLRLVERGYLNFDEPISTYLPDGFELPEQVTARTLLLHTAGLDERLIGYQTRDPERYSTLADHLRERLPSVNSNLDNLPSYSNYGYALLGLAVETIVGKDFRRHVENTIFHPLGMERTLYMVPPLDSRFNDLATEYVSTGEIEPIHFSNPYPAGGIASTGQDMARFLGELLDSVQGRETVVISAVVGQSMFNKQLELLPGLESLGFGFNEQIVAGRRVWLKGGSAPRHSAVIAVIPEDDTAIFVALNRQEPMYWNRFLEAYITRFHRHAETADEKISELQDPIHGIDGTYQITRVAHNSIEKLAAPLLQIHVTQDVDGAVLVDSLIDDLAGGPFYYAGDRIFRSDSQYVAFRDDPDRQVMFMNIDGEHFAFRRVEWFERSAFHFWLAITGMLILLTYPILRAAGFVVRKLRNSTKLLRDDELRLVRTGHIVGGASYLLLVSAIACLANVRDLIFGPTPALYMVSISAILFIGSTIYGAWTLVSVSSGASGPIFPRIHLSATIVAASIIAVLLMSYQIAAFRY